MNIRSDHLDRQSPLGRATVLARIGSIAGGAVLPPRGAMQLVVTSLEVATRGPGLYEFTHDALDFVAKSGVKQGLLTAFCRHTSASLLIQENADGDVKTDLLGFFRRIAPEGMDWIVHRTEGADDMPAHIKAALTQTSIGIPVINGEPAFGTWQGIYLFEHRAQPHRRTVLLQLIGEA